MPQNASTIISVLASLESEWEYAKPLREKIERGEMTPSELAELSEILFSGIKNIEDENRKIEMENILFQRFLINMEEQAARQEEEDTIDSLLSQL